MIVREHGVEGGAAMRLRVWLGHMHEKEQATVSGHAPAAGFSFSVLKRLEQTFISYMHTDGYAGKGHGLKVCGRKLSGGLHT